jgi:hypothetical protein
MAEHAWKSYAEIPRSIHAVKVRMAKSGRLDLDKHLAFLRGVYVDGLDGHRFVLGE